MRSSNPYAAWRNNPKARIQRPAIIRRTFHVALQPHISTLKKAMIVKAISTTMIILGSVRGSSNSLFASVCREGSTGWNRIFASSAESRRFADTTATLVV